MRTILIGGGKVGSFLAGELVSAGHFVSVIEPSEERAQAVADDIEAVVICGDGTDVSVLQAADTDHADWLLAVTGLDEVNLVACQLGLSLGADRVLARLNAPANRATFEALHIPVVAVTDLIAKVITQEIVMPDLQRIAVIGRGELSLSEIELAEGFEPISLAEIELPRPSVVAAIMRGDESIVPEASTVLHPGDKVFTVTTVAQEPALERALSIADSTS